MRAFVLLVSFLVMLYGVTHGEDPVVFWVCMALAAVGEFASLALGDANKE